MERRRRRLGAQRLSLGAVERTVAAVRRLRVVVDLGHRELWIAGSGSRPTTQHLTTAG